MKHVCDLYQEENESQHELDLHPIEYDRFMTVYEIDFGAFETRVENVVAYEIRAGFHRDDEELRHQEFQLRSRHPQFDPSWWEERE